MPWACQGAGAGCFLSITLLRSFGEHDNDLHWAEMSEQGALREEGSLTRGGVQTGSVVGWFVA